LRIFIIFVGIMVAVIFMSLAADARGA